MPFVVTPVKEVEISFDEVEAGDHLILTLEDKSRIILTATPNRYHDATNSHTSKFVLVCELELLPYAGYLAMHENASRIISHQFHETQRWYEGLETPSNLYDELLSAMLDDEPASVYNLQIGEVPVFHFKQPFSFSNQHGRLSVWEPGSPIESIAAIDSWQATVEAGKIRAERELHALRIR